MGTRTFSEVALCHLPDAEISWIRRLVEEHQLTSAYINDAGFMIWRKTPLPYCRVARSILSKAETDYVLFDRDVEPDPDLETYDV